MAEEKAVEMTEEKTEAAVESAAAEAGTAAEAPQKSKSKPELKEKLKEKLKADQVPEGYVPVTRNLGFIQRDYINPKNLGFMRVILVFLALQIVSSLLSAALAVKGEVVFDFGYSVQFLNVVLCTVSFWLLWRRKAVARPWIIGVSIFNITAGAALKIAAGVIAPIELLLLSPTDLILILYFAIAKRPKYALTEAFSMDTYKREAEMDRNCFRPKTWPFWRDLIIYFCVFSVVGHWMEAAYCMLIRFGILPGIYDPTSQIWSDWLYPFPVYGFGVVACILIFYPLKLFLQKRIKGGWKANAINVMITLVVSGIVCCGIELVMGLTMNMDYALWDYRTMFCNFMGQICLQNGIAFGMAATLMTWVFYPALESVMEKLPREVGNGVFIGVVAAFSLLILLYCFMPPADLKEAIEEPQKYEQSVSEELREMNAEEVLEYARTEAEEANINSELAATALENGEYEYADKLSKEAAEASDNAKIAVDYYKDAFLNVSFQLTE